MKALLFTPPDKVEKVTIENTLKALQQAVGGYIETVTIASNCCLICNEEGRINPKMRPQTVLGTIFYGPVLLVGTKGDEFTDVPEALIKLFGGES